MPPKFHTEETKRRLSEASQGNTNKRKFHQIVDGVELKHCHRCNEWKPLSKYFKHITCWDGLTTWCKACTSADNKARHEKCPEKRKLHECRWRTRNRERYNENAKRKYRRIAGSPKYRISASIRIGIYQSISGIKLRSGWQSLVGYSVGDLTEHLEKQFQPSMSWENYGEWHIDHIRPIASFEFNSPDDPGFKECWALQNLQPLWATENMAKGARYESRI